MLELKHISYSVQEPEGTLDILKDISLCIDEHRLVVFTGPNGGGKTTLAKIIMGLVTPTAGQIIWNGQDVTHMTITERAKLGISYGFQQPPRFKGLTVRDLLTIASGDEKLSKDKCCSTSPRWGSAPMTIWTVKWMCPSPAARSSALRSPPFWPGTPT